MQVAIKYGAITHENIVDAAGDINGQEAGPTLVRRLMRLFPGASLIGPEARRCNGFDVVPLAFVDAAETLVINMDVIDSVAVWQTLHSHGAEPKLMNFMWHNPSRYHHPVNFAAMGLSFGLFPTFCSSERTAEEVREVVRRWALRELAESSRTAWVNLGINVQRVKDRAEPSVPVVLYPAIYMDSRKRPKMFMRIIDQVAKRTPLKVEARLHESSLISDLAMALSTKEYAWVGPLTATKESYWRALAHTTAFLATASDEAYGLSYVEALMAGVVGVFPDLPWARALLPQGYPFIYSTEEQAATMLQRALTETAASRADIDACAGGSISEWIRENHNDDEFDEVVVSTVNSWFPQG
ncbi:MAG: glycosyltransferase family 1 protein [Dermatophilus congolensis]|nr:glycosyltransferase family 1 protein [Dermatophilus congolensis]